MRAVSLFALLIFSSTSVLASNPQDADVSVFETITVEFAESVRPATSTDISIPVDDTPSTEPAVPADQLLPSWESWTSPDQLSNSLRVLAIMAALSVAPALVLMTTCYVRIAVVLSLLRHALGSQQSVSYTHLTLPTNREV